MLLAACGSARAVTLEDAVLTALRTNPRVSAAQAEQRATAQDLRAARGGYLPRLDLDAGYGRERSNIKAISRTGAGTRYLDRYEFGLTLRQMIFDGFGTRSEVERQSSLLESAASRTLDVRELTALRAAEVFVSVLVGRELVDLASTNVAAHVDILEKVRIRVRAGLSRSADVSQAEARVAASRSVLTAREGRFAEAKADYERVIGEGPGALAPLPRPPMSLVTDGRMDPDKIATAIADDMDVATRDHPALKAALAEVDAAQAAMRGSRSSFFPRIDAEVGMNRDGNLSGVEGPRNVDSVMVFSRWNLFRGGSDQARERAATERKFVAADIAADVRRSIERGVTVAVNAKATSEERISYIEMNVDASRRTLEAYKAQLELGRRTLLDTLNAEAELFSARSNLSSELYNDRLNQYFIEASKGVLIKSLGLPE